MNRVQTVAEIRLPAAEHLTGRDARNPTVKWGRTIVILLSIPFLIALLVSNQPIFAPVPAAEIQEMIPSQADWTDYGPIFDQGAVGEWDYILWGAFTNTAVKKDGTYYLYYQGAGGYRMLPDETVLERAIGVATSPDGINFTKSDENPVVTWSPSPNGEEGAVSGGITLDDGGEIVLYYGANTAFNPTSVNADGRLATSSDGVQFTDQGIVLDHTDSSIWGFGDELFPILAIHDAGQWIVYYLPNGGGVGRNLGVAWGAARDNLNNSAAARSGMATIGAWGPAGKAKLDANTYAIFINDSANSEIEVRTMSPSAPDQLSAVVETYPYDHGSRATVLLDEETDTWFMFYRRAGGYGVKLAPHGEPDATPPTAPITVTATAVIDRQIDLAWDPATDTETGIVLYKVFRDGEYLDTVKGWAYSDTGLVEQTEYSYEISAVNYHGVEGPRSAPTMATTLADVTPPSVESVNASGGSTQATVVFDEPVEESSAETLGNYDISPGVLVTEASLKPDMMTVALSTTAQCHNKTYRIRISGVQDRAETPNSISPGTMVNYTHSDVGGLAGAWNFDEGSGDTAGDTSNFGNDGTLTYTNKAGPTWITGTFGTALQFDGIDDQVTVDGSGSLEDVTDGSHSFEAWVFADSAPPNVTVNDSTYSVLVRSYTGLYYDHDETFRGEIRTAEGTIVAASSGVFEPGAWHHLVMVVDDAGKQLHLYVDGQEVGDSPATYEGALADHQDAPYFIGTSEPLTDLYEYRFKGKIDETRVYDQALSPAQVQLLYQGQENCQGTIHRAYLPMSVAP